MRAPEKFVLWMTNNKHIDEYGEYRYHPRSDAHSKALCLFVLEDIIEASAVIRRQAKQRRIVYGINTRFQWANIGKTKTLDLALGPPSVPPERGDVPIVQGALADVWISCEAKSCMTEHGKSRPRLFDELSSSHEIVHRGRPDALACAITVINICKEFVSPTRQSNREQPEVTVHKQPAAAGGMVQHLRGLRMRDDPAETGFDAFCSFLIDCDNRGPATLWQDLPAPQPGDSDHYDTFISKIVELYARRFRESS